MASVCEHLELSPRVATSSRRTLRFRLGPESQDAVHTHAKRRRLTDRECEVEVHLVELIRGLEQPNEDNDKHYGLFVWPSALVLARFVAYKAHTLCPGKVVLELGCGTGLPAILAGICTKPAKVVLTDRGDADDIRRNVEVNIELNRLESLAQFLPLSWGDMNPSAEVLEVFQTVDVVLAADCFYQSEDFEKVVATVALIFRCSASSTCRFYFTYHLRSITRSIAALLSRWDMTARAIDTREFSTVCCSDQDGGRKPGRTEADVASVYLYEIRAKGVE